MLEVRHPVMRLVMYDRRVQEAYERGIRRRGLKEVFKERGNRPQFVKDKLVHILNVHEAWRVDAALGERRVSRGDKSRKRENVRSWADLRRYGLRGVEGD